MDSQDRNNEGTTFDVRALLEELVRLGGSDLHLTVGQPPKLRLQGVLQDSSVWRSVLGPKDTVNATDTLLNDKLKSQLDSASEFDFSFGIAGLARFRANIYRQRGTTAVAIRTIPFGIPSFETLGLPLHVADFASRPNGMVLITGATGSGKSTTLAALIDKINRERRVHILTIEDPIEFVHNHQLSMVNQREVGTDTRSFTAALKYALRQDPDVVLIGEMRDSETIAAAITTAETGHLVFATLHSNSAAESVDRMIDVFPHTQQPQIRTQLAAVLEGIVTQQLLPKVGGGLVMAAEVLVVTNAIRAMIREDKTHQIYSAMQAGSKHGMQTMNQALFSLYRQGSVTMEEVLGRSEEPEELRRLIGQYAPVAGNGR
jgi:twitching motility protein PilT